MKKILMGLILLSAMTGSAFSADTPEKKLEKMAKSVQEGCKKELTTFCKDVTPGEGRLLACVYAYSDKLSSQCEYALYDAATQLQHAIAKIQYVATECAEDIEKQCANVAVGEGRILNCLKSHEGKLNERCKQALKDTVAK